MLAKLGTRRVIAAALVIVLSLAAALWVAGKVSSGHKCGTVEQFASYNDGRLLKASSALDLTSDLVIRGVVNDPDEECRVMALASSDITLTDGRPSMERLMLSAGFPDADSGEFEIEVFSSKLSDEYGLGSPGHQDAINLELVLVDERCLVGMMRKTLMGGFVGSYPESCGFAGHTPLRVMRG